MERPLRWPALIAAAVTFATFSRALTCGFVDWDDGVLLLDNPDFRGLGWHNLRWMFTTTLMGNYQPITWMSFGLDYELHGMKPAGYHLTNVLLHSLNAGFLYLVALRLYRYAVPSATREIGAASALLAALLFSVHPLRVESVAWVTERKDVLSLFFLLLSLLAYVRFVEHPGRGGSFVLSLAALTLSLLSKPWGMTWFAVLLVLDWYPLRRWCVDASALRYPAARRVLAEKAPVVLICAAAGAMALYVQTTQVASTGGLDGFGRLAQSCYGLVYYPWKTLAPSGLSPIHEHPRPLNPFGPVFIGSAAVIIVSGAVLWSLRRRWPGGLASNLIYVLIVAPVLGLVQVGPQIVAERYSYVACIPFALLAGGAFLRVPQAVSISARRWAWASAIGLVAILSALTWQQTGYWRDPPSLWTRALSCDPESFNAHGNLGAWYFRNGELDSALSHLRRSHEAMPQHIPAAINLASCLGKLGRRDESLVSFRQAAKLDPSSALDWVTIGNGFVLLSEPGEARAAYERAISRDERNPSGHYRLAKLLEREGNSAESLPHYRRVVELTESGVRAGQSDPGVFLDAGFFADACVRAAALLAAQGDGREAELYRNRLRLLSPSRIR